MKDSLALTIWTKDLTYMKRSSLATNKNWCFMPFRTILKILLSHIFWWDSVLALLAKLFI